MWAGRWILLLFRDEACHVDISQIHEITADSFNTILTLCLTRTMQDGGIHISSILYRT